jgi:Nif-specific ferredoxin III
MDARTRDGRTWQPAYLISIDAGKCIGCGRCYKVCGQGVLGLRGVDEEGALVDLDGDDEVERKVMTLADPGACIGCGACARVCAKACQEHQAAAPAGASGGAGANTGRLAGAAT